MGVVTVTGFSYNDFVTRRTDFESGGQGGGFGEVEEHGEKKKI